MRVFNLKVFDDIVTGTGITWYSTSELDAQLGRANFLAVQATATNVSGTAPTLTVASEHSSDSEYWIATGANEVNGVTLTEGASFAGSVTGIGAIPLGAHVRYSITLGGTSPQCRLKIHVTGHDQGA